MKELEGVKNRVSGAEYEIQTLKEQVTYLRAEIDMIKEQVKELYRIGEDNG
tara:strand:+ start:516 stop:668 length:153 start_codon:yes stop_codon:yes gene_type:complete